MIATHSIVYETFEYSHEFENNPLHLLLSYSTCYFLLSSDSIETLLIHVSNVSLEKHIKAVFLYIAIKVVPFWSSDYLPLRLFIEALFYRHLSISFLSFFFT